MNSNFANMQNRVTFVSRTIKRVSRSKLDNDWLFARIKIEVKRQYELLLNVYLLSALTRV